MPGRPRVLGKDARLVDFRAMNAGTLQAERALCKGFHKHTTYSHAAFTNSHTAPPCDFDITYFDFQSRGKN